MSFNNYHRQQWCRQRFVEAVELFHAARQRPENESAPLVDLARRCANSVFAGNVNSIVGDKETCARLFMKICREEFGDEVQKALVGIKSNVA